LELVADWITQNYEGLEKAAKNVSRGHDLWPDLLSHCILDFMEKPQAQKIVDDGYAKFYIVRIMMNQWRSVTSPFFKQWRSDNHLSVEDSSLGEWYHENGVDPDWNMDKIQEILDQMEGDKEDAGWYHARLVQLYSETPNYKRLSEMTGISRTSISKSIGRARDEIKKRYYK